MIAFAKHHWKILLVIAVILFIFGVWAQNKISTVMAAILTAAVAAFIAPWTLVARLIWLFIAAVFLNFTMGFLPFANGWYDWIPRKNSNDLNATINS